MIHKDSGPNDIANDIGEFRTILEDPNDIANDTRTILSSNIVQPETHSQKEIEQSPNDPNDMNDIWPRLSGPDSGAVLDLSDDGVIDVDNF